MNAARRGERKRHKGLRNDLDRTGEERSIPQTLTAGPWRCGIHGEGLHRGAWGRPDRDRGDRVTLKIEGSEACGAAGITPWVPKPVPGPAVRQGFLSKDQFPCDPSTNFFTCPGGQALRPCRRGQSRDSIKIETSRREACLTCQLRPRCIRTYRQVARLENEAVLDRMAARLATRPKTLDQHRTCCEHALGTIEQRMNHGAVLMKRAGCIHGEFSLTALVCNSWHINSLIDMPSQIAATRGWARNGVPWSATRQGDLLTHLIHPAVSRPSREWARARHRSPNAACRSR
ncbi:transposase [Rubellimicrobium roseum]|uniref:transposase n=1 Tax=Rubellimicrobium roseum TaxID=687525 RepID=UPI00269680F8